MVIEDERRVFKCPMLPVVRQVDPVLQPIDEESARVGVVVELVQASLRQTETDSFGLYSSNSAPSAEVIGSTVSPS